VTAALVPGVVESAELPSTSDGTSLLTIAELENRVADATILSGYVVVHAGSGDLADGMPPSVVATDVQALWQAIAAKGATPIVALALPSDEYGAEVIELNALLQGAAATSGFDVLDLYSPVATAAGSWNTALSSDGALPNASGSQVLAQAAIAQLPPLTAAK
jgi:lysophospholipase L1-like esterase